MQLFVKYLVSASTCEALQWAVNRAGKAKRQQGGVRNKTKDRASLERSERRGFCFVGKKNLLMILYPPYFRRMLAGIEDVDDIHILVCYLINEFVPPF